MADLQEEFTRAAAAAKSLKERPSNDVMLELYALYKQATVGDAAGERPGMFDLVGRAKWDAWAKRQGTSKDAAMRAYIDLVASLE